jgi:L-cysteine/cystine lyase
VADLRGDAASAAVAVQGRLEAALSTKTRLVVLSHLLWNTGQLMPIATVAKQLADHPNHPYLLVDAAQSLGSIPVTEAAAAADIYGCTGHKWCCGPEGLGAMVVSERVLVEAQPTLIGWRSILHENQAGSSFHSDSRRFEVATSCIPLFAGLNSSLALLDAEGSAKERLATITGLSQQLWQQLQAVPKAQTLLQSPPPAGLVSFTLEGPKPEAVVEQLGAQGIWVRSLDDPHCLRACTHLTTTPDDITRLIEALANLVG